MDKTLYMIRGVPGSGKSTFASILASALACTKWEADDYHMVNGEYQWKPENVDKAHQYCRLAVQECMSLEHKNIIVSNTSTTEKELKPYLDLAEIYGYRVVSLIVENRHGGKNIHDVPEETIQKMKDRFSIRLTHEPN